MLTLENDIMPSAEQWQAVIMGMRNPMNSWSRSDTHVWGRGNIEFGKSDIDLMQRLVKSGSDHAKFLRMLPVMVTVNAPLYWWKEYDTYKVGTTANSCSTMHKLTAKPFELDDFSTDHLEDPSTARSLMNKTIEVLNLLRKVYLEGNTVYEKHSKKIWYEIIQLLPSSYNQKRTLMLNYAVLRNIYHARRHHKLDEWHLFCDWIETLPLSELITEE